MLDPEFDPEKVERHDITGDHGYVHQVNGYVLASDYDQLLERYRNLLADFNKDPRFDIGYESEGPLGGKLKFFAKPPRTP